MMSRTKYGLIFSAKGKRKDTPLTQPFTNRFLINCTYFQPMGVKNARSIKHHPIHCTFADEETKVKRRPGPGNTMAEPRRQFRAPILHCEAQRFQLEYIHATVCICTATRAI